LFVAVRVYLVAAALGAEEVREAKGRRYRDLYRAVVNEDAQLVDQLLLGDRIRLILADEVERDVGLQEFAPYLLVTRVLELVAVAELDPPFDALYPG